MLAKKDPNIGKAVGVLKELSEDERMQLLADSIELAEMDRRVRLRHAVEEAVQQGLEQGVKRGLEQGIEQGVERGIQQVVKNAHKMNMSIEDIIKLTGLSEKEIQEICS